MSARILLIGNHKRSTSLHRNWEVVVYSSGKQAIQNADKHRYDLVIVDAASLRTSGERMCRALKKVFPNVLMIHIQPRNDIETEKVADVTLSPPLSSRKLVGIISRLLNMQNSNSIACGPFEINPVTRILQAHGQEVQLNPKLANLTILFFTHPNEVLDREKIMNQVWDTNYMGDTRTLDVHIRHLRNVLENGNKKPRYLKTVRGVGYRLEVTPDSNR